MNPRKDLSRRLEDLRGGAAPGGKKFWRSLEELADSPDFRELMRQEFPDQTDVWTDQASRRRFLKLMSASLALAGLGGCSVRPAPEVDLVPYVRQPEEIVAGRPLFYATAMTHGGAGVGLLVESHMGRPTKVEGNPSHPASLGATDVFGQASVLSLYDPDRSQSVTHLGHIRTWDDAFRALRGVLARQRSGRGGGLRVLSETIVSPTLARQVDEFLEQYPDAQWHQYEPLARDGAQRGTVLAFGEPVTTYYDFRRADRVLSLGADFLTAGPGCLRYARDFIARRRVRTTAEDAHEADMNRLYVVETAVSPTGVKADHRLALPARDIPGFARALAARLGVAGVDGGGADHPHADWVRAVAADLEDRRGKSVVVAGDDQPAEVHLLAHALNHHLGNVGATVFHAEPVTARPVDQTESLRELTEAMTGGEVQVLFILGGNPVYTAPSDLDFAAAMDRVPLRVHLSQHQDETSRLCHWHLPEAHFLEAWGDTRAYDGTASIVQPLIEPLYQGRSAHELVHFVNRDEAAPGRQIVRATWRRHWESRGSSGNFEEFWLTSVHDGVVADTQSPAKDVSLQDGWAEHLGQQPGGEPEGYELVFQPDPTVYDGRYANNGWLQELPKPLTKITWDNAAIMSPATAREIGVGFGTYAHGGEHGGYHQPMMELRVGERSLEVPAWIQPGHADGSVTLWLGYGRSYAGRVGGAPERQVGFNAYSLRTSEHPWAAPGLTVRRTGETYLVACTQQHHLMENRDVVRRGTLEEYRDHPDFADEPEEEHRRELTQGGVVRQPLTMYPQYEYPRHKWGMAIDLTACVGCNACVVACQAENNIPVVGKEEVAMGREMHWLRVDRYVSGTDEDPDEFYFQPVPCMHCENAPCEYVCPVEATVHSSDGLNDMIYNRCVGTRFCSNNCPYKVRRFNFLAYADFRTESIRQQYNPDVTVRSRGVMEKCTYCVQRIRRAEIDAQVEQRPVFDGEILTACQAACPARAIVFGDLNDPAGEAARWKATPLNYGLLSHLNTEPRTSYLAALRNPNPDLEAE